jgi:CubicO group peptidase (beta-lactamase class C family)
MKQVAEVQKVCKAPSISIGILHGGKVLYRKSLGLRDVENNLGANSDTSYLLGSCSKLLTSAAVGILAESQLSWTDLISKHVPEFNPIGDPRIGQQATIVDACRHSTGLANPNAVFFGPQGTLTIKEEGHVALLNALPTSNDSGQRFNSWWYYSNAAFGVLSNVVKAVSGMHFCEFVHQRLCQPLAMEQTLVVRAEVLSNSNIAHPYVQMEDGHWTKINNGLTSETYGPGVASMGMRSSVNDMLKFCAAVMDRYDYERNIHSKQEFLHLAGENPLRQISSMWGWWWSRPVDDGFDNNTAYMLGWWRTTMPTSALGQLSYNSVHRQEDIIGKNSEPRTLYGHNGITEGSVATTYLIPASHSAIVVLSNAADAGDASEATAQIILQALFDLEPSVDLVAAVLLSRNERLERHEKMILTWQENRDASKYKATPEELVGSYVGLNVSRINIVKSNKSLSGLAVIFSDQGISRCELEPYNSDSLSYLPMKHDEILARGMIDWDYWTVGIFNFVRQDRDQQQGDIVGLEWKWDQYDYPALWVKE